MVWRLRATRNVLEWNKRRRKFSTHENKRRKRDLFQCLHTVRKVAGAFVLLIALSMFKQLASQSHNLCRFFWSFSPFFFSLFQFSRTFLLFHFFSFTYAIFVNVLYNFCHTLIKPSKEFGFISFFLSFSTRWIGWELNTNGKVGAFFWIEETFFFLNVKSVLYP